MSETVVRSARATDIDCLIRMMQQYWFADGLQGFHQQRLRLQLQAFLATPAYGCCWVAEENATPIAYLIATFIYSFEHGGLMAEIDELFVTESRRDERVATHLLAVACQDLEEHGCVNLQMRVATANTPARQFYAGRGFLEKAGYSVWGAPLNAVTRG